MVVGVMTVVGGCCSWGKRRLRLSRRRQRLGGVVVYLRWACDGPGESLVEGSRWWSGQRRRAARLDSELAQRDGGLDAALPSLNERLVASGLEPIERRALIVEEEPST